MSLKFNLILAKTESNGIGYKGRLPWRLKNELGYFQKMTTTINDPAKQNAVIMGRLTWEESMPDAFKPLPGRLNIVLSSKKMNLKGGAIHCYNIQEVVEKLTTPPLVDQIETSWVIGGAKLYESVIAEGLCRRLYMTTIMQDFTCDTFVNIDVNQGFKEVTDPRVPTDVQQENGVKYLFKVYEKL